MQHLSDREIVRRCYERQGNPIVEPDRDVAFDFVDINADVNFVVSGEINVVEKSFLLC
jgi:hypothetical protein